MRPFTKANLTTGSLLLALTITAWSGSLFAHHSFSSEFDSNKPVALEGEVIRVRWVNPHSWLYIDVPNPDGSTTEWAIEFGGPYSLLQKGLRRTDFEIGGTVKVTGYQARSGDLVANASSVTLPNGQDFYTAADDSPGAYPAPSDPQQ